MQTSWRWQMTCFRINVFPVQLIKKFVKPKKKREACMMLWKLMIRHTVSVMST
uniref:Uncharacterized protein n=1 Tax=Anguilla anguilla TaxID=7936 RepID=A0A0E9WB22_ANGAN